MVEAACSLGKSARNRGRWALRLLIGILAFMVSCPAFPAPSKRASHAHVYLRCPLCGGRYEYAKRYSRARRISRPKRTVLRKRITRRVSVRRHVHRSRVATRRTTRRLIRSATGMQLLQKINAFLASGGISGIGRGGQSIVEQIELLERSAAFWQRSGASVQGSDPQIASALSAACKERSLALQAKQALYEDRIGDAVRKLAEAQAIRKLWQEGTAPQPAGWPGAPPGIAAPGMMPFPGPGMMPGMPGGDQFTGLGEGERG